MDINTPVARSVFDVTVRPAKAVALDAGEIAVRDARGSFITGSSFALARRAAVVFGAALLACANTLAQVPERSGKQVVDQACIGCHGGGRDGAPRIGDNKAWEKRASQGLSGLTKTALAGVRKMPSHGGKLDLSDGEIERAIIYMVNRSGGKWIEPVSATTPAPQRTGEQVVQAQCVKCHGAGVNGAPRIGDRTAWTPRISQGLDAVVRSAIHGHGGMPARGGMADATDLEIRAAVLHMFNASGAAR